MSNRLEASRKEMNSGTPKWEKDDTPEKVMDEIVGLNERAAKRYDDALKERLKIKRLYDDIERLKQEIRKRQSDADMLNTEANEIAYWASKITKMFLDHERRRAAR